MQKSKSLFLFLLFNVSTLLRVGWGPVGSPLPAPATTQSPSLSFPGKKNVCVTQQSWSSVVLPITDLLCLCSSVSCGGGLIRCEGCVESLSFSSWWLQQFCFVSSSMGFLGKLQFLGNPHFICLMAKGRDTSVPSVPFRTMTMSMQEIHCAKCPFGPRGSHLSFQAVSPAISRPFLGFSKCPFRDVCHVHSVLHLLFI